MPLTSRIRTIPDYPKKGIMFRDITTLFKDPVGLRMTIDQLAARYLDMKIDKVAGIEARGPLCKPCVRSSGIGRDRKSEGERRPRAGGRLGTRRLDDPRVVPVDSAVAAI